MFLASEISQKISFLKERARMLKQARMFFEERNVLEVDCPALSEAASVDTHIDLIRCQPSGGSSRYLHSSPEYGMKRLLALGTGDIYQLSHVFRDGEYSVRHNPEFTMAEWYRCGFSFEEMIAETCEFISLFVGPLPVEVYSYKEMFLRYTGINPFEATCDELLGFIAKKGEQPPYNPLENTKDDLLSFIVACFIDPYLGKGALHVIAYFPPSQAALAKVREVEGELVAERFEVFCEGLELSNGYHELQDAKEQHQRLLEANECRIRLGKDALPIDTNFLEALEMGLPDSCGVAVGFDRLMMLRCKVKRLTDVIAWDWLLA
jgi:elongation factor P--(R)-beta-lysine ligase